MIIRKFEDKDLPAMIGIWNEIVDEGIAFPQEELLDINTGKAFFESQTYTAVAEIDGTIAGLYILHPNNVGRCGHICNASYAVSSAVRGQHIGEKLFEHVKSEAKRLGCYEVTLNVWEGNDSARGFYDKMGLKVKESMMEFILK